MNIGHLRIILVELAGNTLISEYIPKKVLRVHRGDIFIPVKDIATFSFQLRFHVLIQNFLLQILAQIMIATYLLIKTARKILIAGDYFLKVKQN